MKYNILILLFLFGKVSYGQDYSLIKKAERKINKGKLKKAEKLLDKAEKADYGFCGNAHIEADEEIRRLRNKIYTARFDTIQKTELDSLHQNKIEFYKVENKEKKPDLIPEGQYPNYKIYELDLFLKQYK